MARPLDGIRVVEMAGIGPGPHAAMILADLGADVVRVDRASSGGDEPLAARHTGRGRRVVRADLKDAVQRDRVLELVDAADVLVEGFRPGVMERLGLGPDVCVARNAALVYARMTGWGQSGPLAACAGHDINYISLTGVLHAVGPGERPLPPLNLAGDYGGGSMFLVTGILAALVERGRSGLGQVVDAAMVDGASVLAQPILELRAQGLWNDTRGENILDGAAPYYRTYSTSDGKHMAVGAIEPQFWGELLTLLGLSPVDLPDRDDPAQWQAVAEVIARVFARRTRAEWCEVFDGTDACVTPVLSFAEAPGHAHMSARGSLRRDGEGASDEVLAAAAPRFSRSSADGLVAPGRWDEIDRVVEGWTA